MRRLRVHTGYRFNRAGCAAVPGPGNDAPPVVVPADAEAAPGAANQQCRAVHRADRPVRDGRVRRDVIAPDAAAWVLAARVHASRTAAAAWWGCRGPAASRCP